MLKSVFTYTSYREYLNDFYCAKKKSNPSNSFRFFAKKAGLLSGNYLKLVMDGERNLTHKTVLKFIKGLNLNEWEGLYFENLVFFNQTKDENEKAFYFKNMELARIQNSQVLLTKDQYEVLANWHPLAIKELGLLSNFQLSSRWIASKLDHKITPQQAKEALELLKRLGLIQIDHKAGKIHSTHQTMNTPDVDTSGPVATFHTSSLKLALDSIEQQTVDQRCLSALIVAVQKKDLPEAFKKIHKFVKEMNSFFTKGRHYDSVYQLSLQLFRMDNDV